MFKKEFLYFALFFVFFITVRRVQGQYSSITSVSITDNNLKIDLTFDEEIYSNSSCSTLTCIDIADFGISLSGGIATLASNTPMTITKLGNYDFSTFWDGVQPDNFRNVEHFAQHQGDGDLNDLPDNNLLNGVLELINPIQQVITGYTYVTSYPIGSDCAHSYYRSTSRGSWTNEKLKAQNAGGDLLVYNSPEEFTYMIPAFGNNGPAGVGSTWVGMR